MGRWSGSSVVALIGGMFFAGCATPSPCPTPQADPAPMSNAVSSTSSSSALEQKVKAQEKRIAELSMQLKLLKRIDLEEGKR
jgi:hypothetical protein